MNYESSRGVKSSFNLRGMTQCFPVTNAPIHWKRAIWSNGDNGGNLLTPCRDLSLPNRVMSSASLASNFPEPGNLCARSSTFCTSLHVSPSSTLDPHTQIPHPRAEYQMPQTQTLSSVLIQGEDLAYQQYEDQINEHSELLGDIIAGNFDWAADVDTNITTNTAEQKDWQVQSKEFDLIMNNDQNPGFNEINKATAHSLVQTKSSMDHHQRHSGFSFSLGEETNSSISGYDAFNKPRMRWTQKLHDCFVQAVNDLGGADRATPKSVQIKMGIEGVTIYHVKSHLQKYRLARYQPDAKEDKRSSTSEVKKRSTTDKESEPLKKAMHDSEALRMQWELQKSLHDQLEFQRELQLRAEENARQLQKLLEEQKRVGQAFMLASQSLSSTSSVTAGDPSSTTHSDLAELIVRTDQSSTNDVMFPEDNEDRLELGVRSPSPKKAKLDLMRTSTLRY